MGGLDKARLNGQFDAHFAYCLAKDRLGLDTCYRK